MPLWRFTPVAGPEDSRWLSHPHYEEVVVAAPTPGEALSAAGEFEKRETAPEGVGNESVPFRPGLTDEKLYRVDRLPDEEAQAFEFDGDAPAVLAARRRGS